MVARRRLVGRRARRARLHRHAGVGAWHRRGDGCRRLRRRAAAAARSRHDRRRHARRPTGRAWSGEVADAVARLAHACLTNRGRRAEHGRHARAACRARSCGGRARSCASTRSRACATPRRWRCSTTCSRTASLVAPGEGSDIADPDSSDIAYPARRSPRSSRCCSTAWRRSPIATARLTVPLRLFTSRNDHVVDPADSEYLVAARTAGRSSTRGSSAAIHVATRDYDRDLIVAETLAFVAGRVGMIAFATRHSSGRSRARLATRSRSGRSHCACTA